MIFKLDENSEKEALKLKGSRIGSHLYAPDKPMKGWVLIPNEHSDKWKHFATRAIEFTQ